MNIVQAPDTLLVNFLSYLPQAQIPDFANIVK